MQSKLDKVLILSMQPKMQRAKLLMALRSVSDADGTSKAALVDSQLLSDSADTSAGQVCSAIPVHGLVVLLSRIGLCLLPLQGLP